MEELKKKILELFTTHDNKIVWVRVRAPHFTSVNRDQARAVQWVARSVLHAIVGPRQENGLHIYHCSAFHAFLHCKLSSSPPFISSFVSSFSVPRRPTPFHYFLPCFSTFLLVCFRRRHHSHKFSVLSSFIEPFPYSISSSQFPLFPFNMI